MPRRLRIHVPGGFYHVTLRGNHQQAVFVAAEDRLLLNKIVSRAIAGFDARLHAYCWMSNHLHFLIQVGAVPLSSPMRQIASEFARAMQIKLATTGHFFERRYHATLVDADSYLLELLRYIHLNPVRAGIVQDPSHFPWSSHHAYIGARIEAWLTTDFLLQMLAENRERAVAAYKGFVSSDGFEAWAAKFESKDRNPELFGSDEFIVRIERQTARPSQKSALTELIDEACNQFNIERDSLDSPVRDPYRTQVRAWIAVQARERNLAGLSAVARALGRDESTLREAIKAHHKDIE